MLKLSMQPLGRLLRVDEPLEELGISTYDRLKDAVKAGDKETIFDLIDYAQIEGKGVHDLLCDWVSVLLTWIAENCGEEKLLDVLRYSKEKTSIAFYDKLKGLTVKQLVQFYAEGMRAHRSGPRERGEIEVREEEDKYVMSFDPCGSGGRMRRTGELDNTPPRAGPPFNFGKTKKAYPWSWFMKDVPYYCLHCCVWHEIMPIEATGVPAKITEYDPDPNAPCKFVFYKNAGQYPVKASKLALDYNGSEAYGR